MEKKQLILLIFVIGISIVFIVQMFAIGFISSKYSSNSGSSDAQIYSVRLSVDSELASYGSYLSVEGNYDDLENILMRDNDTASLVSSMIDISNESVNKTLIYLSDSLYTKQVSNLLSDYGYKMYTDVNLRFPANTTLEGKVIDLAGNSIRVKAPPVYDIGDRVKISLSGYVQYDKLIYIIPESIYVEPITKDAVITMGIKAINKIEFSKIDGNDGGSLAELSEGLNETIGLPASLGYSLEQLNNTVVLKFNVTAVDPSVTDKVVDYLSSYFDAHSDEIMINSTKSYVRLYSEPVMSKGIYDSITFNYPLSGLYYLNDTVDMNITLLLDWGKIMDIKMVRIVE